MLQDLLKKKRHVADERLKLRNLSVSEENKVSEFKGRELQNHEVWSSWAARITKAEVAKAYV